MGVRGKGFWSAAVFEAPAVVASFDDIAVMGDAPKGLGSQRGGHFGVAEHGGPFSEGEIENGGAKLDHGSGGEVLLRAA